MEWSQDDEGRDAYAPTQAIVLFPKIVTMGAHAEQLIRLGYQGPAPTDRERSYRVYLTELPVSRPGDTTLKMAMRLGVPVFISPAEGKATLEIAGTRVSQAVAQLQVKNTGRHHAYLQTIRVVGRAASGGEVFTTDASGWYVLPGRERTFPIELPNPECARAATLQFSLRYSNRDVDQPPASSSASVTPSDCAGPGP
jgi:fimbrial chaperone protein